VLGVAVVGCPRGRRYTGLAVVQLSCLTLDSTQVCGIRAMEVIGSQLACAPVADHEPECCFMKLEE
jgi:hypothetical protein